MKKVRIIVAILIMAMFLASCGLNKTTTTFSVTIIGENDQILLEEKDASITYNKNDTLTYKECIIYVLEKNNVEYVLDDKGYRVKSMYGLSEYADDEHPGDSGAYWYMELNQFQIIKMSEEKITDGNALEIKWREYDRHKYCEH